MFQRRVCQFGLAILSACMLTGCMPTMTIEQMKAMMPERPAELDKLNTFVGSWTATGEAKMMGVEEPMKVTGTSEAKWGGNNWYVVGHNKFNMEGFDEMEGIETWTYDSHSRKYRSTWTDSMGATGTGVSWVDDKTNTWHMRATSHGPFGKTKMKGWAKVVDDNTMEWGMSEYAFFGLFKTMEMKGTSKRK